MMTSINFKKYASLIKKGVGIDESIIEKDYMLSLFLTNAKKLMDKKEINHFNELVFKGGTLLTKSYLDYHRISEDLDFTHKDSINIRKIASKNSREKRIKKLIIPLLDDIKKISDVSKMKFETNRTNKKYVKLKNSRNMYLLRVYYDSIITKSESSIKIEINFIEELLFPVENIKLVLLSDKQGIRKGILKSLNYDLQNIMIHAYSLKEIILEKYRAILTRKELKERDVFDLYLINKNNDVFNINDKNLVKKIKENMTLKESEANLKKNKKLIEENNFYNSSDDITKLSLIEINKKEYNKFKNKLLEKLKTIIKKT